ncbi:MAG: glucodextranase DOMON-like domain-containing protein [bacterium]
MKAISLFLTCLIFISSVSFCGEPARKKAVLWVPAESSDWETVLATVSDKPGLCMTLAVSSASKSGLIKLKQLEEAGKLQTSMRIQGDPVLPLLFYPNHPSVQWKNRRGFLPWPDRPDEMALRVSAGMERHVSVFGKAPSGWVPAGGGVVPDFMRVAKALGINWVASGPSASTQPCCVVENAGSAALVHFSAWAPSSSIEELCPSTAAVCFLVFDETPGGETAVTQREGLLSVLNSTAAENGWLTVSAAIEIPESTPSAGSPAEPAAMPWAGDYMLWAGKKSQLAALFKISKTLKAWNFFQNSGLANPRLAGLVAEEFRSIEAGEKLLRLAGDDREAAEDAENELQNGLADIYRQTGQPIPSSLLLPLSDESFDQTGAEISTDAVTVEAGDSFLILRNSSRQPSVPEDIAPAQDPDSTAVFKLKSVRLDWDEKNIDVSLEPGRLEPSKKMPGGFNRVIFDLYVDMNRRPRSGSSAFLQNRGLRPAAENAWEYALVVSGWKAVLFKATPRGPTAIGEFKPYCATETGQVNPVVKVSIPRNLLNGNPAFWSYCSLIMPARGHSVPEGIPEAGTSASPVTDYIAADRVKDTVYSIRISR